MSYNKSGCGDIQPLLALNLTLFEPNKMEAQGEGFEQKTDFLDFALQALHRIDVLLAQQSRPDALSPTESMHFEAQFACVLLERKSRRGA